MVVVISSLIRDGVVVISVSVWKAVSVSIPESVEV